MLWIDRTDAPERVPTIGEPLRPAVEDLMENGVTVLRGMVAPGVCDRLVDDFRRYCDQHPEEADFRDAQGLHSRFCNFHMASAALLGLGLQPQILALLDCLFEAPASIATSLFFEKGSEQGIHRDSPFFHTEPEGHFFGVWTALEEVSAENGPLCYYLGGHKAVVDRFEVRDSLPGAPVMDVYMRYQAQVVDRCQDLGLPYVEAIDVHKGDVIVWHPRLPHGGVPLKDPTRSRLSAVFHYLPEGTEMRGVDTFFSGKPFSGGAFPTISVAGRRVLDQGAPTFLANA